MEKLGLLNFLIVINFGPLTGLINNEQFTQEFVENKINNQQQFNIRHEYELQPTNCGSNTFILVLVNSNIENFEQRNLIRETWGSVKSIDGENIQVLFNIEENIEETVKSPQPRSEDALVFLKTRSLFGKERIKYFRQDRRQRDDFKKLLKLEHIEYGDILYTNASRKVPENSNLFGFNWITENCSKDNRFVVNTLDNVFIEMYHLYHFLSAVYGEQESPLLGCHVLNISPQHGEYCDTSAYVLSSKLIPQLLKAAKSTPPYKEEISLGSSSSYSQLTRRGETRKSSTEFRWLTGRVRKSAGISPVYLNIRYSHDEVSVMRWLRSPIQSPSPFIFVHLPQFSFRIWSQMCREMWRKSRNLQI